MLRSLVHTARHAAAVAVDAFWLFQADDGWAIASHIALSILMALFPFLIVLTALASFFGSQELANQAAGIIMQAWPKEVAGPIAGEVHRVLTTPRGGLLTIGAALAAYFASSGVESLRIGLNRAYGVKEMRPWWLLRLESIAYVLLAALALIALAFLVVLEPLIFRTLLQALPGLAPFESLVMLARFGLTTLVLLVTLVVAHKWLPAGRRSLPRITPGVLATFALLLAGGALFGRYLASFAQSYISTYAGLASVMIALVFLYWSASFFIYGGELNAVLMRGRAAQ
jgi:membrane protein